MPDERWRKWLRLKSSIRPEDYVGADESKNEQLVREGFAAKAKRYLAALPMAEDVVAAYFCMLDPLTPRWVKGVVAAALAYFVLPVDAVLDAIPFAGLADDASVLAAALTTISAFITDEHRTKARSWMAAEKIAPAPTATTAGTEPGSG